MACEDGLHLLHNPYNPRTQRRRNDSWTLGFKDAEDIIYGTQEEVDSHSTAECD